MYAGLIQLKGGFAGAAAAIARAAAAANKVQSDDSVTNADHDSNVGHEASQPRGGDGAKRRAEPASDIKKVLPPKKLNSDGSFGDPRLKFQAGSKVPLPWTCPHPECGRNNFQWRKSCPHCGTKRPPLDQQNHEPTTITAEVTVISEQKKDEEPPVKKPRPTAQPPEKPPAKPPAEVARGNQANPNLQVRGNG